MTNVIFGEQNVKNVVNSFVGGQRGVCVVALVSLDKKLDKAYKGIMDGRLSKVVAWYDRPLVSYSGDVNAKADTKFVPQAPKGFVYTQYPYFKKAIKSGIEYLSINFRECDKGGYDEVYFLDGVVITKAQAKAYLKEEKVYAPKTQVAVGVTDAKEQTKVVVYEIGKIAYIGTSKEDAEDVFNKCQE